MPSEFKLTRRIEFAETDMAGIVHFANFFRMMESTEHAFFRSLGLTIHGHEAGTTTVFKPGASYEWVATNKLGEKAQASCAVDGDALLLRTEKALYRIEKK